MRTSGALALFVAGAAAGALAAALLLRPQAPEVAEGKNPKLAAAGRRGVVAAGLNTKRYRCAECDHATTAGPMGVHHKVTGHQGREPV